MQDDHNTRAGNEILAKNLKKKNKMKLMQQQQQQK